VYWYKSKWGRRVKKNGSDYMPLGSKSVEEPEEGIGEGGLKEGKGG
jgi:hypothetical protein